MVLFVALVANLAGLILAVAVAATVLVLSPLILASALIGVCIVCRIREAMVDAIGLEIASLSGEILVVEGDLDRYLALIEAHAPRRLAPFAEPAAN